MTQDDWEHQLDRQLTLVQWPLQEPALLAHLRLDYAAWLDEDGRWPARADVQRYLGTEQMNPYYGALANWGGDNHWAWFNPSARLIVAHAARLPESLWASLSRALHLNATFRFYSFMSRCTAEAALEGLVHDLL